jgi:hypothetical protein
MRRLVFVAALLAAGLTLGRSAPAQDDDAAATELRASVAAVRSGLVAWSKAVGQGTDLGGGLLEQADGLGVVLEQGDLSVVEKLLGEVRAGLVRRRDELIFGSTATESVEPPPAKPKVELAKIDLRDLSPYSDGEAPPALGILGGRREAETKAAPDRRNQGCGVDADRIRDFIDVMARENLNEPGSVEHLEGCILIRAPAEAIARARYLLAQCRAATATGIALDVRSYRLSRDLWAELARSSPRVELSAEAERRLAEALAKGKDASLVATNQVVARDGETVEAWTGETTTYVQSVESARPGEAASIARIATQLYTGARLTLRPILDAPRETVLLDLSVDLAEPSGPFAKEKVLGAEIELPEVSFARQATRVRLRVGRPALVLGSLAGADSEGGLVSAVLVRPSVAFAGERPPEPLAPKPAPPRARPAEAPLAELTPAVRAEIATLDALLPLVDRALAGAHRTYRLAFFDARDLLDEGPAASLLPLGLVRHGTHPDPEEPGSRMVPERLEAVVKYTTGADEVWGDPASYDFIRGTIFVRQTDVVIARIAGVLAKLRSGLGRPVRVETGLYRVEPGLLASLEALALADGVKGGSLSPRALAALDEATAAGRATLLSGSFVVTSDDDRVYVEQGRERRFVAGLEAAGAGLRPTLGLVRTGSCLELRAHEDPAVQGKVLVSLGSTRVVVRDRASSAIPGGHAETQSVEVDTVRANATILTGSGAIVGESAAPGKATTIVVVRCVALD